MKNTPMKEENQLSLEETQTPRTLYYIDTHTHLYDEVFDADRGDVVQRAVASGATKLFLPNCDETTLEPMLQMCRHYRGLCYPMIGLHPTEMPAEPFPVLQRMEHLLEKNRQMAQNRSSEEPPFIAIGEVGIDLYWDVSRREEQIKVFARQVEWALQTGLPLMIHAREAQKEVIEVLRPYQHTALSGVFHCFTGSADEAAELLEFQNFGLGIGGVLTFKKSTLRQVLHQAVPLNRIVLETDSPYMAPVPHRGKRNESSFVPSVIDTLAQVYEVSAQEVCDVTNATVLRLFPKAFE